MSRRAIRAPDPVGSRTRFRWTEQNVMGECRGDPDYPTMWRAGVLR